MGSVLSIVLRYWSNRIFSKSNNKYTVCDTSPGVTASRVLELRNRLCLGSDSLVMVRVSSGSFLKESKVDFWLDMGREHRSRETNVC